jgi:hypothetical protein
LGFFRQFSSSSFWDAYEQSRNQQPIRSTLTWQTSAVLVSAYSESAERFRDTVTRSGADALISNHRSLDRTTRKLAALANRKPGDPHPYVVGNDAVRRYLTVADECAKAGLLRLN